jgi:hypothetical protein
MPTLSNHISAVLDLCGNPAASKYPNVVGQSARIINQVARTMMREARLSDQNQYLRFLTLNSPTKEKAIPSISDPNSICTVELLVDSATDSRVDVPIIGRLELNANENRYACARFGRPTTLRFTWNPADAGDTLYVGYETLPTDASQMGDIPNLPESFHDGIDYRAAALLKETILEQVCTPVFLDTMNKIEKQWSHWTKRDAEERPVQRPAFGSLDYSDPMEGWY